VYAKDFAQTLNAAAVFFQQPRKRKNHPRIAPDMSIHPFRSILMSTKIVDIETGLLARK
jgi:hypothetical protein